MNYCLKYFIYIIEQNFSKQFFPYMKSHQNGVYKLVDIGIV